jgi:hypothetical protein
MKAKRVSVSRSFILYRKHHIQSLLPGWGWTYEGISPERQYTSRVGQTFDDFAKDTSGHQYPVIRLLGYSRS